MIEKVGVCENVGSAFATVWSRIRHEILVYFMFEMCIPCDVHCNEIYWIEMTIFYPAKLMKNVPKNELKND